MDSYKALIGIVDDDDMGREVLCSHLSDEGFHVIPFISATEFLNQRNPSEIYDLIISDINMPGATGYDLCRALRAKSEAIRLPIILITGNDPSEKAQGLNAGADDFISKPFSTHTLVAKMHSLLGIRMREIKRLKELETSKVLNHELKRFISPNLANRILDKEQGDFLQPHRADVTVFFADLRRFTTFSEKSEPDEVLQVLQQYYSAVGQAAMKYKGTLGHLAGDGIMVFFNDPEPISQHKDVAVRMALEARESLSLLKKQWDEKHYDIDFGIGLGEGFATIGGIGFDRFSQYSVIGTVANFASRLCHIAVNGQILVSHRYLSQLNDEVFNSSFVGNTQLRGLEKPVKIHNILSLKKGSQAAS